MEQAQRQKYPKVHVGHEHWKKKYKLRARQPWVEFPILNNRDGRHWTGEDHPGPVRAIYTEKDRKKFDVVYHDPTEDGDGEHQPFRKARRYRRRRKFGARY